MVIELYSWVIEVPRDFPANCVSESMTKRVTSAQRRREVTLKPNDKAGGCSLLDVPDYQAACISHLQSTFTDTNGQELPYYRQDVPGEVLGHHWARIKDTVDEGVEAGYVHGADVPHLYPQNLGQVDSMV